MELFSAVRRLLVPLVFIALVGYSQQMYLPGLAPVNYCKKSESSGTCKSDVILYVNRLNTEESVIPFEYHHFDFCTIDESNSPEGIHPGPYKIEFLKDVQCDTVCTKTYEGGKPDSDRRLMDLKKGISLNYQHHWIVDNMPVTSCYQKDKEHCSTGIPMGCLVRKTAKGNEACPINLAYNKPGVYYPFNHVDLTITYHSCAKGACGVGCNENGGRIISVKVVPSSIDHKSSTKPDCKSRVPIEIPSSTLPNGQKLKITYTYSVKFVQDNSVNLVKKSKC